MTEPQSGRQTRVPTRSRRGKPLARLKGTRTRDEGTLIQWDQELAAIEQAAEEALEEARMG